MQVTRAGAGVFLVALAAGAGLPGCALSPDLDRRVSGTIAGVAVDENVARRAVSDFRLANGAGRVILDPALRRVAQRQADAMARADLLSQGVAGTLPVRLAAEDATRGAMAENVSAGYGTFERVFAGWQRSPPHKANLLYKPLRRMGIAAASAPNTRYRTFWSLVMTD